MEIVMGTVIRAHETVEAFASMMEWSKVPACRPDIREHVWVTLLAMCACGQIKAEDKADGKADI